MNGVVVIGRPNRLPLPPLNTERGDWVPRGELVQAVHRAQQDQDRHAHARYGHLQAENGTLRDALELISGSCANAPGPSCRFNDAVTRDNAVQAYRWCPHCIASHALNRVAHQWEAA